MSESRSPHSSTETINQQGDGLDELVRWLESQGCGLTMPRNDCEVCSPQACAIAAIASLRAENERLKADAERLDWLERNAPKELKITFDAERGLTEVVRWHRRYITSHIWGGDTLRDAIDSARKKEGSNG